VPEVPATGWLNPSDQWRRKGGVPVRWKERVAGSPAQTVAPPERLPDGGVKRPTAADALAEHVPSVATTDTVTGSAVPRKVIELVPCPETRVPLFTVQAYVAPAVAGTEAVPVTPAHRREGALSEADATGFTVTRAKPDAVPAQDVSVTVRTV